MANNEMNRQTLNWKPTKRLKPNQPIKIEHKINWIHSFLSLNWLEWTSVELELIDESIGDAILIDN